MIDLPKLELDEHYYLKLKNGKIEIQKFIGGFVLRNDDEIAEVLGIVPSYDEYQKLLSDQLAKNEGEEINAELEVRLKKTQELELELRKENIKLKELLKACRNAMNDEEYWVQCDLIKQIDELLGEE